MFSTLKEGQILVVEDNPGDFLLVEEYLLEKFNVISIEQAKSCKEAESKIQSGKVYDIVLLDLNLPDLSGDELVERALSLCKCPVIVLTGYTDLELAKDMLAKGVADFLIKDEINPEILYKSILYALERKRFIHDLKVSRENYMNLFHMSPQPKWIYELATYRIIDVNSAALQQYGYTREEFLEKTIHDLRPPEYLPQLTSVIKRPLSERQNAFAGVFTHQKKNGEIISVEIYSRDIIFHEKPSRMIVAIDITERKRLQEELQIISYNVEKRERSRIALSLHNGLQQTLLAAFMNIDVIGSKVEENLDEKGKMLYKKGLGILKEAINSTRKISHEMMPFEIEELGLSAGIESILGRYATPALKFEYKEDLKTERLPMNLEIMLFRTIQEAINNVVKHAEATEVILSLKEESKVISLDISDNGKGFDIDEVKNQSLGLKALKSTVGSVNGVLEIDSAPGKGTLLKIRIPVTY